MKEVEKITVDYKGLPLTMTVFEPKAGTVTYRFELEWEIVRVPLLAFRKPVNKKSPSGG